MEVKIFWCKANKYYTDKWLNSEYLKDKKWYFVASCAVTDKAKRKWIKFVKDIIIKWNLNNQEKIYLSWCSAFKNWKVQDNFYELYPELYEYKDKIELLDEEPTNSSEQSGTGTLNIPNLYTKKFIIIQGWCNSFCSFCLTVIKRWRHFSRSKEDILKEIIEFEKSGWKEIVLTWINLWAWWLKTTIPSKLILELWDKSESKFGELLEYILDNSNIKIIRISSLWCEFVDEKCLEIFKNPRIYPHFHYSVQSWSSKILKSMKRHYNWEYIKDLLLKTKNLKRDDNIDISIWADIIVWFPWETQKDFEQTYNLIKNIWIQKIHVFPFSWHKIWETIPAWEYPNQIDEKTKKQRVKIITELAEKIRDNFKNSQKWKTLEVLIESVKDWKWKWWTQNYIEANNENFDIIEWEIKRNEIVKWRLR